jgi:hypothetical protein
MEIIAKFRESGKESEVEVVVEKKESELAGDPLLKPILWLAHQEQ